jgi:hypothetical protein
LLKVADSGANLSNDNAYDANGTLKQDNNKGISAT